MNKYEFKGNLTRGKKSQAAKQAFHDMMMYDDDITLVYIERPGDIRAIKIRKILDRRIWELNYKIKKIIEIGTKIYELAKSMK